jgi:hypothetical protein
VVEINQRDESVMLTISRKWYYLPKVPSASGAKYSDGNNTFWWEGESATIELDKKVIYLDTDFTGDEDFSPDITGRVFEGYTVTYVALQLAFYMGFEQAILVGVDHNFVTQGTANMAVVSQGDDPNHFAPNYFGKGFKWQLPDLAVGRIPAQNADQVRIIVDKTLAYEQSPSAEGWRRKVLAIADGQDPSFKSDAQTFLDGLSVSYQVHCTRRRQA